MPSCGINCLINDHLHASPVGAAAVELSYSESQNFCQNCPNRVTYDQHSLCRNCARPGSVEYAYHHRYCRN